jgi:hypothetical protein
MSLPNLVSGLVLGAKCAGVAIYLMFVATEGDSRSARVLKHIQEKRGVYAKLLSLDHVTTHFLGYMPDLTAKAALQAPKCSRQDKKDFGGRVWCHFKGNPHEDNSCEECRNIWNALQSMATQSALATKSKLCGGHNYVDYAITDHALR